MNPDSYDVTENNSLPKHLEMGAFLHTKGCGESYTPSERVRGIGLFGQLC